MDVRSLGYRTDLFVRRLAGSEIVDRGDHLLVRTRHNPGFYWGNFILIPAAPGGAAAGVWLARFLEEFPGHGHVAIGVDRGPGDADTARALVELGLTLEDGTILTTTRAVAPAHVNHGARYRRLRSQDDWRQVAELRRAVAAAEGQTHASYRLFLERGTAEAQRLAGTQWAAFFGAFQAGTLGSWLGLVGDGAGTVRFQNVETHPEYRRRGLAGSLVHQASSWAATGLGARTLVIAADPAGPAIRLYRSLGFSAAENQLGLSREPAPF